MKIEKIKHNFTNHHELLSFNVKHNNKLFHVNINNTVNQYTNSIDPISIEINLEKHNIPSECHNILEAAYYALNYINGDMFNKNIFHILCLTKVSRVEFVECFDYDSKTDRTDLQFIYKNNTVHCNYSNLHNCYIGSTKNSFVDFPTFRYVNCPTIFHVAHEAMILIDKNERTTTPNL